MTSPCAFEWQPFASPQGISLLCEDILAKATIAEESVANQTSVEVSFASTIGVLNDDEATNLSRYNVISLLAMAHPEKPVRDAANEAQEKLRKYFVDRNMNRGVYKALLEYRSKNESLHGERQRYLSKIIEDFELEGLRLPEEHYEQVKQYKKRLSELSVKFESNLTEDSTKLELRPEELGGMTPDFLESLKKTEDGSYVVTIQYPHYLPIMDQCKVEGTRKKMHFAFEAKCIDSNTPLIEEAITLRHDAARLLGFENHAAYVLSTRMAKRPEIVKGFLEEVSLQLNDLAKQELDVFRQLKAEEMTALHQPFDGKINCWDYRYYLKRVEERFYDIDHSIVKNYFPIDVVIKGVLDVYQELLSLRFQKIETTQVWFEDVTLWEVIDADTNTQVGHFYMDLHPREGKYGHACMTSLVPGYLRPDGSRQTPVAAIVCNFTKPTDSKPSLLEFEEVETFFHEFGHVMHELCSVTEFVRFHGCGHTETDFVECPSQMLENWCYEIEILQRVSANVANPSEKIPLDLAEKLRRGKVANIGVVTKRQLLFGLLDMELHTQRQANTQDVVTRLEKEIRDMETQPGTNLCAGFGHLMGGYDAGYYGYLFSKVLAVDLFYTKFQKQGCMNKQSGREYREKILRPGASKDGFEMIIDFLGRIPNADAFLIDMGVHLDTSKPSKIGELLNYLQPKH